MIVSILQLMGFPMAKPVHSRAGEAQPAALSKAADGVRGSIEPAQMRSARRQEVKATEKKTTKAATSQAKAVKVAAQAATKPAAKDKPVVKPVAKPVAKSSVGSTTKASDAKPKPAAKPATKVSVKAAPKVVAKPVLPKAAPAKVAAKAPAPEKIKVAVSAPPSKPAPAPVASVAPAQKTGRPSSRLAQLTVPSMAQSVASTAAKASYSQSIPSPVIVPALPSSIKKDAKLANNWKTKPVAELTDAELMAMSDDDYMNEVQLAAFRLKLSALKQDILNSAGETTEHLREDTSVVPDPADRATIEEEHALELRTRDRERKLLKKIEQSIARIDAGDYGYCDETGEPIGVGRLLARPTATLSLEAQQRRELKQKMFGD